MKKKEKENEMWCIVEIILIELFMHHNCKNNIILLRASFSEFEMNFKNHFSK